MLGHQDLVDLPYGPRLSVPIIENGPVRRGLPWKQVDGALVWIVQPGLEHLLRALRAEEMRDIEFPRTRHPPED